MQYRTTWIDEGFVHCRRVTCCWRYTKISMYNNRGFITSNPQDFMVILCILLSHECVCVCVCQYSQCISVCTPRRSPQSVLYANQWKGWMIINNKWRWSCAPYSGYLAIYIYVQVQYIHLCLYMLLYRYILYIGIQLILVL